ncbi:hypothetical protein F7642_02360 [Tenacibaculum finnmarkense genomovar ulcerans]|uniref:hypothetical protein n=1 Tax=Tenacibaculum finnmarkense TaxID=2781243 RepID=UPI00187B390E|nr:hypothetical protein [Tenacibaculum finnmarkense]MBE7633172.1 hypothetical protein [Tenacibaculum finnmarkense genomovar ulcerans]MCD8429086.1 hypothetical protein [Tenacibaculum finnmarkense genomovar ulcerans]
MNQIKLSQFIIGSQYEEYEFDLEYEKTIIKNNIEYVIYRYKKYEKYFFLDTEIKRGVFLSFNGDILMEVTFLF